MQPHNSSERLLDVARRLAWLGLVGVGGPAAHIALMRRRLVQRDGWVSDDEFSRLVGACALIPGPNSTEMAMALGARRAGWRGLLVGGLSFILPAFAIVCAVAVFYEDVLTSQLIADIRRWVVPIIVAIILDALLSLRTSALRDRKDVVVVIVSLATAVFGLPELLILILVGAIAMLMRVTMSDGRSGAFVIPVVAVVTPSLFKIFVVFLQIGSVIFGSGYVLLVFLESEVVARGWISSAVLLDAISVGQLTPGPVFTTATFIGWHLAGFAGAAVATLGIFGPSFVFAGLIERVVLFSQRSRTFSAFLRGVSSGSIALMAVVLWRLGNEALVDVWTIITFVAAFALIRLNVLRVLRRLRH